MRKAMIDEVSNREVQRMAKKFRRAIIGYGRLAIMFKAIIIFTCIMMHMRHEL